MKTSDTPMTRYLVERGVFKASEFGLVDVGASRGIDPRWAVFGDQLRAWGFDPLDGEVERLNALGRKNVTYHAAWVGYKGYQELLAREPYARPDRPSMTNDPRSRLSVWKAVAPAEVAKGYDGSRSTRYAERNVDLDDFFSRDARAAADFVKTDTDGHDYEVLLGAAGLLKDAPVLGVQTESIFHGALHPHAQLFANVDRLMREAGFSLFDMSAWRYSRAALPSRFVLPMPAQTEKGQLWWGDLLYFRDLGDPVYEENWGLEPTVMKVLKLSCCFESYDLADCAAEVLLKYAKQLRGVIDLDRCLDLLTPRGGQRGSYRDYMRQFEEDPKSFAPAASPADEPRPRAALRAGSKKVARLCQYLWRRARPQ